MKCKKCGGVLYEEDKFCPQCGWKVVRTPRCPECGAALREGTKFCSRCGRLVGGDDEGSDKVFVKDGENAEMHIDDMEQNILLETQQEIRRNRTQNGSERSSKSKDRPEREPEERKKQSESSGERKRAPSSGSRSVPAPPPKKKAAPPPPRKRVYEEWEDEEDEEDDDEEEDSSIMMIVSAVIALLIFAVAAFLIFTMVRKQSDSEPGTSQEQTQGQEEDQVQDDGQGSETESEPPAMENPDDQTQQEEPATSVLTIVSNVNVRDNPGTQGTNVIKVAKAGEVYECLGTAENDEWYMIRLDDGSTGYVFKDYVSVQ